MAKSGTAAPKRASTASKRPASGAKRASAQSPSALKSFYRAHRAEIWGLVAIAGALLCALGIYAGAGGFVGTAFRRVAGLAIGWGRLIVPPALAALGVFLIAGRRSGSGRSAGSGRSSEGAAAAGSARGRGAVGAGDTTEEADSADRGNAGRPPVRIAGGVMLMTALAGILHLAAGRPSWGDALADFEDAGGYVGWAFGALLARGAGTVGAVLLLLALGLLGWLAISGMSLRQVARGCWFLLRRTGALLAALARPVVSERRAPSQQPADPTAHPDAPDAGDPAAAQPGLPPGAPAGRAGLPPGVDPGHAGHLGPNGLPVGAQPGQPGHPPAAGRPGLPPGGYPAHPGLAPPLAAAAAAPLSAAGLAGLAGVASGHAPGATPADAQAAADAAAAGGSANGAASPAPQAAAGTASADAAAAGGSANGAASPAEAKAKRAGGKKTAALPAMAGEGRWRRPGLDLLTRTPQQEVDDRLINDRGRSLEEVLNNHGVAVKLAGVVVGPTVSRYELVLGEGVKVARFTSLSRDIAYALASPDIRILAPIPGRQAIGVEVPNPNRAAVTLGDILTSQSAAEADHPLDVAIGRDITGQSILANLGKMPHILIAGATGAGKSSCINSIITTILMRCTPEQVRLILVDPKMVEMRQYANVPHLLTQPVIDPKKAANALGWAVREMERRYQLLSSVGCRDIAGYNDLYEASLAASNGASGDPGADPAGDSGGPAGEPDDEPLQRLPFIVIVVDELSDLMMVAPREVEEAIWRLAQMARAVGVHLVIATQRPSTNVITGVIKANIPARMALSVSSLTDSRVILDQGGAERLVGHGDMLLLDGSSGTPRRIQGAWVSEEEIRKVTAVWRRQNNVAAAPAGQAGGGPGDGITAEDLETPAPVGPRDAGSPDEDDLLEAAMELVVESQLGSTSMLQRKLRVGFARAGRLMDLLEQRGVVGPSEGSKAREVLMTPQELAVEQAANAAAPSAGAREPSDLPL